MQRLAMATVARKMSRFGHDFLNTKGRWTMRLLLVPALLLAFSQTGGDAQKLFQDMEKKITGAGSLDVTAQLQVDSSKGKMEMKTTLLLAKGNKARVHMSGEIFGNAFKMEMISDGAKMQSEIPGGKGPVTADTPKNLNERIQAIMGRAGVFGSLQARKVGDQEPTLDEQFKVAEFKLGAKEKISERDAQVVAYKLQVDGKETIQGQVWIDSETRLPVKRVLKGEKGDEKVTITETYTFHLNPTIDAKKFELPKSK
jgi:outer membrane lipoprotein-sorting protein